MAEFDKVKDGFNKGLEASKNVLDKVMEVSKDALNRAGSAVQDFSDKSVVRIEKKQFESKRQDFVAKLGEVARKKLMANPSQSVNIDDSEVSNLINEIKKCDEEITKREQILQEKNSRNESTASSSSDASG
ncbi:MAG: hypothetical protein IJR49_01875 [Treponema sp.]|nr:hypothetical protein [Treponema sp.]